MNFNKLVFGNSVEFNFTLDTDHQEFLEKLSSLAGRETENGYYSISDKFSYQYQPKGFDSNSWLEIKYTGYKDSQFLWKPWPFFTPKPFLDSSFLEENGKSKIIGNVYFDEIWPIGLVVTPAAVVFSLIVTLLFRDLLIDGSIQFIIILLIWVFLMSTITFGTMKRRIIKMKGELLEFF